MALKFHPDKNRAPGSDEIFKKVRISLFKISFDYFFIGCASL